jgi:hypothetical protein
MKTKFAIQLALTMAIIFLSFTFFDSCARIALSLPTLTFIESPAEHKNGQLTVSVLLSNIQLINGETRNATPGKGLLLYRLDGGQAETGNSDYSSIRQAITNSKTYTFHGLSIGSHRISVELLNTDLTELNPRVIAYMTAVIFAQAAPPQPAILNITPAQRITNPSYTATNKQRALTGAAVFQTVSPKKQTNKHLGHEYSLAGTSVVE